MRCKWYCHLKKNVLAHEVFDFGEWHERFLYLYPSLPRLPSLSPGLCGHRYQPLTPVLPGQPARRPEAGSHKRVRGLWEGDREGRTSTRHPDTHMRHTVSSMCCCAWNKHGFQHQVARRCVLTWLFWHFSRGWKLTGKHTSVSAALLSVPLLVCEMKMTVQTSSS